MELGVDIGLVEPADLIAAARRRGLFVYDCETTGLNCLSDRIEGISFYVPGDDDYPPVRAWYPFVKDTVMLAVQDSLDQRPVLKSLRPAMDRRATMEALRPLFEDSPKIIKVAHNWKFDASFLEHASGADRPIMVRDLLADTMLLIFLGDETKVRYGLKFLAKAIFKHEMTTYEDAVKNRKQQLVPGIISNSSPLGIYAMEDVYWTYRLYEYGMEKLRTETPVDPAAKPIRIENECGWRMGKLERIFWGIDMKIMPIIQEMENTGVLIDWQWLRQLSKRLDTEKDEVLSRIERRAGGPINPKSVPQVSNFLFSPPPAGLGLPHKNVKRSSKNGHYSTGSKDIGHLKRADSVVKDILSWRSKDTVQSSFVDKLAALAQAAPDSRIRSHYNQTGTVIFRLSSSDPINLQNQPRDKNSVRKAFCAYPDGAPASDMILLGGDLSQIELRVAAHLSGDLGMIEVYRTGKPCVLGPGGAACERYKWWECGSKISESAMCGFTWIPECWDPKKPGAPTSCPKCGGKKIEHQARCRHTDLHQRTSEDANVPRNPLAKNLNFGNLYRIGPFRFCQYADLYDEHGDPMIDYAEQLIETFFESYPALPIFHEETENRLKSNGWKAYTITGRTRHLHKERWKNEYKAVTQGIQFQVSGTAQDILKLAMVNIARRREAEIAKAQPEARKLWQRMKFLLQVHDELIFECPTAIKDEAAEIVHYEMEHPVTLRVPIVTEVKSGRCWDNVH